MLVDVGALAGLSHRCRPELCRNGPTCCASFEVCCTPAEAERMTGLLPAASRFAPQLDGANPFDPAGDGLLAVDTDEDGLCVFAWRDRNGRTLCSLHSAALKLNLPPHRCKPLSCFLWPLAIGAGRPRVLTVHEDAFDFPCNRRRPAGRSLHAGVAGILEAAFGPKLLRQIRDALIP